MLNQRRICCQGSNQNCVISVGHTAKAWAKETWAWYHIPVAPTQSPGITISTIYFLFSLAALTEETNLQDFEGEPLH